MAHPEPGLVLGGRYRLTAPLARGGMAVVWAADDTLLGRAVAVKTLRSEFADDEGLRVRFRNEATAAARLSHPNIVATYDTGIDDGLAFIVLELVKGPTVRDLLDDGPLPINRAVHIAHGVALALEHAHRNGVVHRDVKPSNVLVPADGTAKVTDFGVAKADGADDLTRTGTIVGTARYLAPEQVRGERSDARSDVYSLGLLLYEMLAGQPAFSGDNETATALARLTGPPTPVRGLRPEVSSQLESVVDFALAVDPELRWPTAGALADALARVPDETGPGPGRVDFREPTGAASGPRRAEGPRRRPVRRIAAGVLVAIVLLGAGTGAALLTKHLLDGSSAPSTPGAGTISIAGAADFDPFGGDGENPDLVGRAVDGDPSTSWNTETYVTRDVGGKPGVGLIVKLRTAAVIHTVTLTAHDGDYDVSIYVANRAGTSLNDWGSARAQGKALDPKATLTLAPPSRGRAVLIWITRVAANGRVELGDVALG